MSMRLQTNLYAAPELIKSRDKPGQRAFVPERLQKNHLMDLGTVHISGMQLPVPAREIYLAFIRRSFCFVNHI